jgi:3-hydroxybutyrate dehydrogenase
VVGVDGETRTRRAALVTGAGSGIGRAITTALQAAGYDVLAVDLDPGHAPGIPFQADLLEREANRAAVAEAVERFGRLDVVVANAGVQHVAPIAEFPEEQWERLIALMLTSPFLLAKYAWPHLQASGDARFIVVASAHALAASPFKVAYVSAKHGAIGLVRTLALEGAADGISTSAVCPAYVRTPLVEAQIESQAKAHGISTEQVLEDVILAAQPVKRLIEPEEVADTVVFLSSKAGRSFTGAPVIMDQGWTAR